MNGAWLSAVVLASHPVPRPMADRRISPSSRAVQRRAQSWVSWRDQRHAPMRPRLQRGG